MGRLSRSVLTAIAVTACAAPVTVSAQLPEPVVSFTPRMGWALAPSTLYNVQGLFPRNDFLPPISIATPPAGPVVGADLELLLFGGSPVRLRLGARQMLLGKDLCLRFNMPPHMKDMEKIGRVLSIRDCDPSIEGEDMYSVHMKFAEPMDEKIVVEATRYIKMITSIGREKPGAGEYDSL